MNAPPYVAASSSPSSVFVAVGGAGAGALAFFGASSVADGYRFI
jgi:hypothetical protein